MNVLTRLCLIPLASLAVSGCASVAEAQPRHVSPRGAVFDYAPVVDVVPVLRTVRVEQPRRECWHETTYETIHHGGGGYDGRVRTAGPTIAGGVVGGVIGNQFGSGRGRDAMTLFGTLVGAAVAAEHAHNRAVVSAPRHSYTETRPVTVERCAVSTDVFEEQRLEGYDVTYLYAGRQFQTRTATPPGDRIRVRVDVQPAQR